MAATNKQLRQRENPTNYRVRLRKGTHSRVMELCKQHKVRPENLIMQLLDFYELNNMPLLIRNIRTKYEQGLTLIDKSHYSVLYTLLAEINRVTKL